MPLNTHCKWFAKFVFLGLLSWVFLGGAYFLAFLAELEIRKRLEAWLGAAFLDFKTAKGIENEYFFGTLKSTINSLRSQNLQSNI